MEKNVKMKKKVNFSCCSLLDWQKWKSTCRLPPFRFFLWARVDLARRVCDRSYSQITSLVTPEDLGQPVSGTLTFIEESIELFLRVYCH